MKEFNNLSLQRIKVATRLTILIKAHP